ncbi:hypothetical protein Sphch_0088 [Sphingobium chlorophenolicum L-1]|uniref:Lipoprotein n=1 Tax=Sphingobium chlorophenolicum L-1 TaxID=690566 RepID=F6ETY3_SPHCR|nr:hypothetical protein [Sphingobium chlorophenolicum]AEG47790.1 hypothetical protein Sphch_0088 [Sphingobium chlorophenolicum L-1]
MKAGKTLLPMVMLALLAGCSQSPGERTGKGDGTGRRAALPDSSMTADAYSDPASAPAILPDIDPTLPGARAAPGRERAPADPSGTAPMKPIAVDIPPPADVPDLPPGDGAADPHPFPDEVTRYMVDRDGCDHFRGEEAYDAERLAYLQDNITALCTGTDTRLALLRQRYAHDPQVMSALSGYDERIEGNASQ